MLFAAGSLQAQPASVVPVPVQQFFDTSGNPLSGGSLTFYAAGTTTPAAVYSDSTLSTSLGSVVTLNSAGRPSSGGNAVTVYLGNSSYKILLKNSGGTTIWTADNIAGSTYLAQQAVSPQVQTTTNTGTQNDFALTCGSVPVCILRVNNAADTTFTGFSGGSSGERLIVVSVGAGNVYFSPQSGSSTAAYRLINFITSGNTPISGGSAEFLYDGTTARWRLVKHEQGALITYTPTIAAQSGTFTSVAGTGRYFVNGRFVKAQVVITITTIGTAGGSGGYFSATLPYTAASAAHVGSGFNLSNAVQLVGYVASGGSTVLIYKYDGTVPTTSNHVLLMDVEYELP